MSGARRIVAPSRWIRSLAIYVSALLVSIMLLPTMIAGWYYADPQSLYSAIGTAVEYTDPYSDQIADVSVR